MFTVLMVSLVYLQIKICTCTGRSSSSSLCNLKNRDISMTCKGCTGESTADRGGPSCSSKLNSMGLELPRPINPEVRWNTVNRRQRAVRRARTFFGEDRSKNGIGSFYLFGSATNQDMSQDATVSESEKLGVSILGRRFCDPMESIPIKKRRFHMDCSPSPPPTPLLVDPYEKILGSSSGGIRSYEKHSKAKMQRVECKEDNQGSFDTDDFSGISMLAAAACESEMDGDILNGACSKLAHTIEERKLENTMDGTKLNLSHDNEDRPLGSSNSAPDVKRLFVTTPANSENLVEAASAPGIDIASDAKSSSFAITNSSGNREKTIVSSQDGVAQAQNHSNVSRDSRLHWDLNVAMEAWGTNCGDENESTVATVSDRNDARNDINKPQTSHGHFGSTDASDIADHSVDTSHMADAPKDVCVDTKVTCCSPGDNSSHPFQNLQPLDSESVGIDALAETIDLRDLMESHIVSDPKPTLTIEHFPSIANVEKIDGSHPPLVDREGLSHLSPVNGHFPSIANVEKIDGSHPPLVDREGLSHLSPVNGHDGNNSLQTSELGSAGKPLASRLVSEESTNLPTIATYHKKVTDFDCSDNKLEEASEQSISECKNQELLDVDSGKKGENGTDVFYVSNRTTDTENLTHPEDNPGSSDCDIAHAHEEDGADAAINSKDRVIACANSSSGETYYISGVDPQIPGPSSECHKPESNDAGSIVDSRAAAHSYLNGGENELRKHLSNACLEQCYETDTSHISKNLAGVGMVDVEEDDSQYEDGELRESGDRYWAGDGYEVKCANWHYEVSDYKNDTPSHGLAPLHSDMFPKNVDIPVNSYNGTQQSRKKEDAAVSPVSSKRSWLTNCLDGGPDVDGKAQSINLRGDAQIYGINSGRVTVGSATTGSQSERCNDGLGDDMLSIRMKNTGWDMLPKDQKHPQHDPRDVTHSSNHCAVTSLDKSEDDESLQKMGPSNRDFGRVEQQKSFDRLQRNELSRSDDGYGSGSKAERSMNSHRSHGIYDASRHIQTGVRCEWVENSKHPRSTRRKSPEYYNYGPSGPRNAAEAAVAKMESNGFVVARDGTLVRAVDGATAGKMDRRMRNNLSTSCGPLSGRGSPINRDGACGMSRGPAHAREASPERHFGVNSNRSGRYGPEMEKGHTTDGNLSSVRCLMPSKQRGISTARSSLNLSRTHSRSPSGSRSRSPHDWASPRNRRKIITSGGSTLRRHSRSPPNHIANGRIGRISSPQRQPGYDNRAMRYSPPSRSNAYSQHTSTWVDARNSLKADLSGHDKRYSRRSPPPRVTSRNDRFDVMDSQGRSRSGEFYRPTQGRLPYGYHRANKHDGNGDDHREYTDKYGDHSVKPYDRNGAVKQFRNNTVDKFRSRISAPRSPELQRRASPRRFDRSFER
ncbi:hypothetical protein U9M48_038894 [Paspalum notatum var. saurae]|uniref:Uncharacterized protein n=1 Tax=Paspalum notatum var. saurae TaxID=547442 RepID=A0AAQ3UK83_PASNO